MNEPLETNSLRGILCYFGRYWLFPASEYGKQVILGGAIKENLTALYDNQPPQGITTGSLSLHFTLKKIFKNYMHFYFGTHSPWTHTHTILKSSAWKRHPRKVPNSWWQPQAWSRNTEHFSSLLSQIPLCAVTHYLKRVLEKWKELCSGEKVLFEPLGSQASQTTAHGSSVFSQWVPTTLPTQPLPALSPSWAPAGWYPPRADRGLGAAWERRLKLHELWWLAGECSFF